MFEKNSYWHLSAYKQLKEGFKGGETNLVGEKKILLF
jgi:hypothetical protein